MTVFEIVVHRNVNNCIQLLLKWHMHLQHNLIRCALHIDEHIDEHIDVHITVHIAIFANIRFSYYVLFIIMSSKNNIYMY